MTDYDVAIVGGGFCGTLTAVHFLRRRPGTRIILIEKNAVAGPGLAYGTADPDHLLNVRAGQMGAFPDDVGHFHRWLTASGFSCRADDFVPRRIYGQYLRSLLAEADTLTIQQATVTDIEPVTGGFRLTTDRGPITARQTVLALGNFPPHDTSGTASSPYDPATWQKLADDGDVLIIGTGLTALDLLVTLAKTKPRGTIHLLSRHGLLPRMHAPTVPYALRHMLPLPATALGLLRALRRDVTDAAAEGINWQSAIDALRPHNQAIWTGLPLNERRRFLRHLRAYWDVHRHRCAPQIMNVVDNLQNDGRLFIHHGRVMAQAETANGWQVEWRPRGKNKTQHLAVRHIVSCTGPQADFTRLDDPLVQNLLARGLIAPDPLRLGIATQDSHRVTGKDGAVIDGLFALGSPLKGMLFESVAVPELRGQAAAVADLAAVTEGQRRA